MVQQEINSNDLYGISKTTDYQMRRYLIEQISLKKQLSEALESGQINEFERIKYNEALKVVENNIQKMRMEGLL